MSKTLLIQRAARALEPRPRMRCIDWARENVYTHEGKPYDHAAYPHLGAPGGPMDAFDCAQYLAIWLQWASRLGKSFFAQSAMLKTADLNPCPMMLASADQKLAVDVTARTYKMLDHCEPLRWQLRPMHRRKQDMVDLAECQIFVAWARSVSTLADKAVRIGHANEIDKWEHASTSKEADPLKLFSDRFKEFPTHKKIFESTPSIKSTSRIERGRLASTNCKYHVPCPKCERYQALRMERIEWEKSETGKSDKELARKTARYRCEHCEALLGDEHRGPMMRAGVWVPEGCTVDDAKAKAAAEAWRQPGRPSWKGFGDSDWIVGTPARDGRDYGCQLSSLYALSLSWGDIAAEFVDSKKNAQNLRNFVNQWLGETWETVKHKTTWEQLGEKLIDNTLPRSIVPHWATLLTLGVDRQEDDRFPFVVTAWGPERKCAVIAYGECDSLDQIETQVIQPTYNHADGGVPLRIAFGLVDSGFRPSGIYEFCHRCVKKQFQIWPAKGSSNALESDYKQATLGTATSMPGMILFHVDTIRSQLWADGVLHTLKPDDAGGLRVHSGSLGEHQDLLEQLLNDAAVTEPDSHNNARESWERIDVGVPNDLRDCLRYAYVAMLIATRGQPIANRKAAIAPKRSAVINAGASRPDGRNW